MHREFGNGRQLQLLQGDITKVPVDAICNAANSELRGGGGVDGAIHAAGGGAIMLELDRIRKERGGCPPGSAVATGAGELPAKYVFHAVGPIYRDGKHGEPELLASAYRSCLQLADDNSVQYLSFPAISAGVYGYPLEEAARIALQTVAEYLQRPGTHVRRVVFVLFNDATHRAFRRALSELPSEPAA